MMLRFDADLRLYSSERPASQEAIEPLLGAIEELVLTLSPLLYERVGH
jgi:hypothetical protein